MSLANLLLPWAAPWRRRWRGDQIAFYNGEERIYCLSGPQELAIGGDKLFSLLPSLGPAGPIDVQGDVAYPLANGRLAWGLTRGVSNESGPKGAIVSLKKGSLIVVVGPKASFLRPHRGDPLKPKWADGLEADDLEENLEL
jgi:hypothetical protein